LRAHDGGAEERRHAGLGDQDGADGIEAVMAWNSVDRNVAFQILLQPCADEIERRPDDGELPQRLDQPEALDLLSPGQAKGSEARQQPAARQSENAPPISPLTKS